MSWYKRSQILEEYSITIDFDDRSQTYNFSLKKDAISAAKNIKGKKISNNSWQSLGFTVTISGFEYNDVFGGQKKRYLFDNEVNKNRKTYFDRGYGTGVGIRDHFEGDKIPFKEL